MKKAFTKDSPYKKVARLLAIVWTLLIFVGCFIPGRDIPDVRIQFVDKYVHFILFGGFAFLWLCTNPTRKFSFLIFIFSLSVFLGWLVEFLQGLLSFLGRTQDNMDTLADSIGGLAGILLFCLISYLAEKSSEKRAQHT